MADDQRKTKKTVTIYGQQYKVVGDESEEHVEEVARLVDEKMNELHKLNPYMDTTKLAVLTAVNMGHEYVSLKNLSYEQKEEEE
ncbi:cell division protein ZapA [Salisediminibacterium halotolerans]|uniref:Cell division protein ZapA n=1 Tax=Salisediminibacterium halotolerans TaxID=517425 RepID=A0A1H9U248_9BACI|nr:MULTISPECIES: cell division protein ZapA [Salisediminibacterium]RLJ69438.1 cell division protein ZapA [Actinophytocola xinjiangensis]RPE84056.1 cell division protein ZapA [Salisediminibacterium halotolerans]TWG32513.1 cell division protein ZapA [Salisediminibacterium halotolerans]SES03153.1 cell division protein ZapA [Salisediminibacterium haloalkalitolerans]GEL09042.1 cell division protein ZapA [Salisediminibacterium halotolerans]